MLHNKSSKKKNVMVLYPGKVRAYPSPVRASTRTEYMITSPKFSTWRPNFRVTFQLFTIPRNDLSPQYFRSCTFEWRGNTWMWKKWQPIKFCVFSRGKTTENGSVSAQRSTGQGAKHLKIERCVSIFWSLKKIFLKSK